MTYDIAPGETASAWGFDPTRLDAWLRANVPGASGPMTLDPIAGGQSNPTFFVSYPGRRLVVRKRPSGPVLPSAHAIDREHRIMKALAGTGVPVPVMLAYRAEPDVVGTAFYVMERLEGRVFGDCSLPGVAPADRRAMFLAMADTLARLHQVDWRARGLADFGREGNFFQRQVGRWTKQWQLSKTRELPEIERVAAWLTANVPADETTTIAHGDFRMGNLMFHPTEPRVVGVLDWELSTLGHPLADVAYSALAWRLLPTEYMGMRGLDHASLGIPSEDEYLERYHAAAPAFGRVTVFHFAFSMFRGAVIFEGIADRARTGAATSANAAAVGALSAAFARRALEAIEGAR
jgi:aminoglycoside phosphotransferase (APT) family kinase protein